MGEFKEKREHGRTFGSSVLMTEEERSGGTLIIKNGGDGGFLSGNGFEPEELLGLTPPQKKDETRNKYLNLRQICGQTPLKTAAGEKPSIHDEKDESREDPGSTNI